MNDLQFMVSGVTGTAAGKHKRGAARINQMIVTLESQYPSNPSECSVNSHVAEVTNLAFVERSILDLLSTTEERDGNWDTAGTTKTDDGDTEEGVESSSRTKVNTSQCHLNSSVEEEGV
jgi:hypothetical protein